MRFLGGIVFLFPLLQLFSAVTEVPMHLITSLLPENPVIIEAGAQ